MKKYSFLFLFLIIVLLCGCEDELSRVKAENQHLRSRVSQLEQENQRFRDLLRKVEKVYHIDISRLNTPKYNKFSGDISRQVFDE